MIYRRFQDMELSALGMGAMRLPVIDGKEGQIDEPATQEMVDYAMAHGINYYDTAWGYHEGQSELVMGRALKKYPRDRFYLASKFPGYDLANMTKVREIFEKQLEKCQVDYFDFYLFHNVCSLNIDAYLDDEKYGIYTYLKEQKRNGRIRHLGFSVHGDYEVTRRFLEAYGEDMEFGQIQLNWVDYDFQDAKSKLELFREYGIPVWVMEPLRGGKLVSLADEYVTKLKALRPDESISAWSFRFLQSIPEVVVTLSGMSNFDQMRENIKIFEEERPLNKEEWNGLIEISAQMLQKNVLPCTACRYCTSYCPQELDIPALLSLYNEHAFTGGGFIAPMALARVPKDKWPAACVGCRSCEAVCPQEIRISEAMTRFTELLEAGN